MTRTVNRPTIYKGQTFEELRIGAESIQDACNLSGIIHSFSRVMTRLWEISREENKEGTDWVNSNEVTRLYASKILHLAGELQSDDFLPKENCNV